MAPSQSLQALQASTDNLTNAVNALISVLNRQGPSAASASGIAGGGGVAGPATATAAAGSGSFWSAGGGSLAGASSAFGPMRQFLSTSGIGGAGILSGLAGGPLGIAGVAAQLGGQVVHDKLIAPAENARDARLAAYQSAGAFDDDQFVERRVKNAEKVSEIKSEDSLTDRVMNWAQQFGPYGGDTMNQREVDRERARRERAARQPSEEADAVEQGVEARMNRYFAPWARAGLHPTEDQYRAVAQVFQKQSETSFLIHSDIQRVASGLNASKPGLQGQQGKQ